MLGQALVMIGPQWQILPTHPYQRKGRVPAGGPWPCRSKHHASPISRRAPSVASGTSGFVDVATAAPGWASSAGITTQVVLPALGPASTSTADSAGAEIHFPRLPGRQVRRQRQQRALALGPATLDTGSRAGCRTTT